MKIYIALFLLVIVSCSKTRINSPIVGSWSLDSIYVSIGAGGRWEPAVAPVTLTFFSDGSFSQSNSNFTQYNHYQIISTDSLRLFNITNQQSLIIRFLLNDKLTFYYNCIEGCADKYRRK